MGGSHELLADEADTFITDSIEPDLHQTLFTKAGREQLMLP
jgi:hypothetical protein